MSGKEKDDYTWFTCPRKTTGIEASYRGHYFFGATTSEAFKARGYQ